MTSKDSERISANEINRFVYCPYQWYYKRTYGAGELTKRYKEQKITTSNHVNHLVRGTKYHSQYYLVYRIKKIGAISITLIILACLAWMVITWK